MNYMFYGNEEPNADHIGDIWISEKGIHYAENHNGNLVWVEKR